MSHWKDRLRHQRIQRNWRQQDLADQLGTTVVTVQRWERGSHRPSSYFRIKLCTLFGKSAEDLGFVSPSQLVSDPHTMREAEHPSLISSSSAEASGLWNVPYLRNPLFTGREEVLEMLHAWLGIDQAVALTQSAALHGLGGIGKTQIALEYAYCHVLSYRAVFWIGAESVESIISSFLAIAEVLRLPERDKGDQQRIVAAVRQWLTTHSQWLLIWDNIEDLELLSRFLPPARQGAILLTTRRQALGTLARGLELLPMEQEEGIFFLLRRAKVLEPEISLEQMRQLVAKMPNEYAAAEELVKVMGGLPLALDQAGAYLEETRCGLLAYLELFGTRRAALLDQRGEALRDHPESVCTTFTLAITSATQRHPAAGELLQICALLHPDAIPEELFRQGAQYLGTTLEAACADELEWNRLMALACGYSLLSRQPEQQTLSIHRLVQAVQLDRMEIGEQRQWAERVVRVVNALFPVDPKEGVDTWPQCLRYLEQAQACDTLIQQHHLQLPEAAKLLDRMGIYLREHASYSVAESLFQRAIAIAEQYESEHLQIASSLNNLGDLYREQGKYELAEPLLWQALHIWEQALGPDHPQLAFPLTNLGILYKQRGKYELAEPLYRRALHIREKALGPHHPQLAPSLNNLGILYRERGKYELAEPLYRRALHIREQTLGPDQETIPEWGLAVGLLEG